MSPLTAANSLFVSQTLSKLSHVDSVAPLDLQPFCSELFTRCRKDADVIASSQYLAHALERDFVDELENCSGTTSLMPAPPRVGTALFQDGLQDLIEVVTMAKEDWYDFANIFLRGDGPFFEELSRKVGELLGVGDFFFHYPASGPVILRLVPPPVLLGGLGVFDWDCRGQPTSEASTAEEVRAMTLEGRRPLRLDLFPYEVHGRKDKHPYIGALHDFLHILRLRRIPRTIRSDMAAIFDALGKTSAEIPRRRDIEEVVLEGPFDDQMDRRMFSESILYERLFRQVNAYLGAETSEPVKAFVEDFYRHLREDLGGHPREKPILDAFAREIYRGRNASRVIP